MRILLPHKKSLGFLVIVFVFSIAGLSAVVTHQIAKYDPQADKMLWEWLIVPDVLLSAAVLLGLIVYSYIKVNQKVRTLVDETMESIASGILHFDSTGALLKFNAAAAIMFPELAEEEDSADFIGTYKKFLAFIYDRSLDIQDQSRLVFGQETINPSSRLLFREVIDLANGRIALVQFYQRPSSEIIVVLTDISMMKRHIEEAAALSEENLIMIRAIEAGGSGMLIAAAGNGEIYVTFANEVLAGMINSPLENIIGAPFPELLEGLFDGHAETLRSAIYKAKKTRSVESLWIKGSADKNSPLWYAVYIIFFVDQDNEYFVCFFSNRTEERLAQAKVYQTQKLEAVAQLAGGIAHDFNNVLSVIDGYAKLAQRGHERGEDMSLFLEHIHKSVMRGSQITSRLLTFGQCRIRQKARIDICEQVRDLEAFLMPMMNYSINMILSVQDNSCYVDAAPDSLTQMIMNLASNACYAMQEGGDLIISVSEASRAQILAFQQAVDATKPYVCIQVIDSGIGIDVEILTRVFEPFFTTKDPAKHSGLGLSLIYGIVRELDALIDIKSTVGVGTSVSILIPMQRAPPNKIFETEEELSPSSPVLQGKTILVVEDSEDVLDMECELLAQSGLQVLRAQSGAEALELQEKFAGPIDFFLTDISMPEMNGIELSDIFAIKRPEAKIIMTSAYPAMAIEARKKYEGALMDNIFVLAKPFVYQHLEEVLIQTAEDDGEKKSIMPHPHWGVQEKII